MTEIQKLPTIAGVKLVNLCPFEDERGRFMETFRKAWFPERTWQVVQSNRSDSCAGVLRGLHYHHHQVDYWLVMRGTIRVGLADLRTTSPTFRATQMLDISAEDCQGLYVPNGVAHGFLALTDFTLTYIVDNYYDGTDEKGVAWHDPELALAWGVTEPQLSPRDQQNPLLADIPISDLPR